MKNREELLKAVLEPRPQLAVFDCDGTLWDMDAGEGFFWWELQRNVFSREFAKSMRERYREYKAGRVEEDVICGEMVTMHAGLSTDLVQQLATEYFDREFVHNIFDEMQELVADLQAASCDVWAVSSSNEWVIRAAMAHFEIAPDHVLAAAAENDNGVVTSRLIRVPSGAGKPEAIRTVVQREPDVAFGNARWDAEMLAMAKHAFAINPRPELEALAKEKNWPIYFPHLVVQRAAEIQTARSIP
jgi:phosphoserine phosphatase